jgi:hypothetical protein
MNQSAKELFRVGVYDSFLPSREFNQAFVLLTRPVLG